MTKKTKAQLESCLCSTNMHPDCLQYIRGSAYDYGFLKGMEHLLAFAEEFGNIEKHQIEKRISKFIKDVDLEKND